ncbi:phosphatidylinositol 3- and 4-kinase family protein [Cryptosporidium andersoni]|uniref:Phosphatidylinositol 3-and 4-kinase family protein n=1 Tax=Cryptosporidium andersoni TaxID=117008 RepID=A0A1J4MSJ0_9CRYT|nr:phosphatidylinositol 3- and 4-kinase family protein [Cryptosporidium andersoni]
MISTGNYPVAQQVYFSTHNALRAGINDMQKFSLCIDELDGSKRIFLSIYPFYDCQMVKRLVIKYLDLPKSTGVRDIQLFYRGVEIPNNRLMQIFEKQRRPLHYSLRMSKTDFGLRSTGLKLSTKIQKILAEVQLALSRNVHPKLTLDGTGATYRMYNAMGQVVAMFKPLDEEAFAPNNPRGYQGKLGQQGFRSGVLSGEGASREVATAIWDGYYHGFAGVPETTLLEASHTAFNYNSWNKFTLQMGDIFDPEPTLPKLKSNCYETGWKLGAFQEYIATSETVGNFDSCVFSIRDVHRIGILDICLFNLDRNDSNILVIPLQSNYTMKLPITTHFGDISIASYESPLSTPDGRKTKYKLVPIDHGLCLPDVLDVAQFDWVWYDWPHSNIPFSKTELRIIKYMDPDADAERLKRKLLIRDECLRSMRVSIRWLKLASSMHLNLHQIAQFLCREDLEIPSSMEQLIQISLQQAYRTLDATALVSSNRLGHIHIDLATTSTAVKGRISRCQETSPKANSDGISSAREDNGTGSLDLDISTENFNLEFDSSSFTNSDSSAASYFSDIIKSKWWKPNKRKSKIKDSKSINQNYESSILGGNDNTLNSTFTKSGINGTVRNTAYRRQLLLKLAPQNVTWLLLDRNKKPIPVQWNEEHFEKIFFEILEVNMKHSIIEKHPNWDSYPYFGDDEKMTTNSKVEFQ